MIGIQRSCYANNKQPEVERNLSFELQILEAKMCAYWSQPDAPDVAPSVLAISQTDKRRVHLALKTIIQAILCIELVGFIFQENIQHIQCQVTL